MAVNQNHVAEAAGVSRRVVYRVLNGDPAVKPETAACVQKTIKQLNYRPNLLGRNLAMGRTFSIGVIAESSTMFMHPLTIKFLLGINSVTKDRGYAMDLSIIKFDETDHFKSLGTSLDLDRCVDGYLSVFCNKLLEEDAEVLKNSGLPTVLIVRAGFACDVPQISFDSKKGVYVATRHLIEQGCRRIAFVAGQLEFKPDQEALEGYWQAIKEFGLPEEKNLVEEGRYFPKPSQEATKRLLSLDPKPDGIVAADDVSAIHVMHVCHRQGLKVPQDIAIIGCNDTDLAIHADPELSTVKIPAQDMGAAAADVFIDLCEGNENGNGCPASLWEPELIVRGSSFLRSVSG